MHNPVNVTKSAQLLVVLLTWCTAGSSNQFDTETIIYSQLKLKMETARTQVACTRLPRMVVHVERAPRYYM